MAEIIFKTSRYDFIHNDWRKKVSIRQGKLLSNLTLSYYHLKRTKSLTPVMYALTGLIDLVSLINIAKIIIINI